MLDPKATMDNFDAYESMISELRRETHRIARERDEARTELEQLREKYAGASATIEWLEGAKSLLERRIGELESGRDKALAENEWHKSELDHESSVLARVAKERDSLRVDLEVARIRARANAYTAGAHVIDTRGVELARELTEAEGRIARLEGALGEIVRLTHGSAFSSLTLEIARVALQALDDKAST